MLAGAGLPGHPRGIPQAVGRCPQPGPRVAGAGDSRAQVRRTHANRTGTSPAGAISPAMPRSPGCRTAATRAASAAKPLGPGASKRRPGGGQRARPQASAAPRQRSTIDLRLPGSPGRPCRSTPYQVCRDHRCRTGRGCRGGRCRSRRPGLGMDCPGWFSPLQEPVRESPGERRRSRSRMRAGPCRDWMRAGNSSPREPGSGTRPSG